MRGRLSLLLRSEERYELVDATLASLCREDGRDHLPELHSEERRREFLRSFLSYGSLEVLLADPTVEDIMINATEPIYVHRTGCGLVKTDLRFVTHRELELFVKKLIVFAGRAETNPINDVELLDFRGRVNIVQSPYGPQITITRGKAEPLTILQLIDSGMLPDALAAQLWMYVEGLKVRPTNLIISGGPGTGKTTLLNALLSFIPPRERLVVIEDTLELNTACLENCSRLESCRRVNTPELLKNSLRMRPERILVGEVRGQEARDLMTAMNLGKYCMGTVHASSARETILRLQNEPMNVPPLLLTLVDAFIVLKKLNADGKVVRMVGEVAETAGMEQHTVLLSTIWTYDVEQRKIVESSPSSIYRDRLASESGRSTMEIMRETVRRANVLQLMRASKQFPDMASVTHFCQRYSEQPEQALSQLGVSAKALERA